MSKGKRSATEKERTQLMPESFSIYCRVSLLSYRLPLFHAIKKFWLIEFDSLKKLSSKKERIE